jgi:hypothetical protein
LLDCRYVTCGSTTWRRTGSPALRGRARCTSIGGRTTRCGKGTTPPSAARRTLRLTSWRSFERGCGSLGWPYIRPAPSGRDRRRAAQYAPVVPAHEVRAGWRHGGHGSAVLSSAGRRPGPLGRLAGRGRLLALLGHLRAEGPHLHGDRGEGGRGDSVPAERARSSASRPRVHAPDVARPLPRNS